MGDLLRINRLKILVIDDEPEKKAPLRQILKEQGFSVIWCRDWNEVNQLLSDRRQQEKPVPNIVLIDMNFFPPHNILGKNPALEGVRIMQKFSETCEEYGIEKPPMIGFTGKEDYMQKYEMLQAGVSDFITAEEFQDRTTLGRRLLQCIQEVQITRMLKPPSTDDSKKIEESIVRRALQLHKNNAYEAAEYLDWKIAEVITIKHRLEENANGR